MGNATWWWSMSLPMKEFVARPTVTMTTEPETESEYATTTLLYSVLVGKSCKLARCYYLLYACLPAFYTWDSFLSIRVAFVLLAGTSRRAWLIWSKEAATEETCSWSSSFNVDGSTTVLHFSPLGRRCRLLMFVSHKFPHSISIEFQCTLRCLQRSWRTIRFIVLWLSLYPQHLKPSYHMVTSHHHHVGGDNEGVVIMHFFRYSGDYTKGHSCYCFFSPTLCILFTNVTLIRGGLNDCLEERPSTH